MNTSATDVESQIANFRPTPREVIGGIAPHVLEDHRFAIRRRRNSVGRAPRRRPSSGSIRSRSMIMGSDTPSPLRISAVVTMEEDAKGQVTVENLSLAATLVDEQTTGAKPREISPRPKKTFTIRIISLRAIATKFRPPAKR